MYGYFAYKYEYFVPQVARRTGGLVWPAQWAGAQVALGRDELQRLGVRDGTRVVGADLPGNPVPSAYSREEVCRQP